MAKPIKITPVLKGKDAVNFFDTLKRNKHQETEIKSKLVEVKKDAMLFKSIMNKV